MKRFSVRRSPVHGRGVFALQPIPAGERIVEYKGEVTGWREAVQRYREAAVTGHTFLFGLEDGRVIDGGCGGNSSRWINHACEANCAAFEIGDRVFIEAIRDIAASEELFIDYELVVDEPRTPEIEREYSFRCRSKRCRKTMLAPA